MWHIDLLLGDDCKTNKTTAVTRQRPASQWTSRNVVFFAWSKLMAVHATMDTTMRSGVFFSVRIKGL
jgi:hypothetical protein